MKSAKYDTFMAIRFVVDKWTYVYHFYIVVDKCYERLEIAA